MFVLLSQYPDEDSLIQYRREEGAGSLKSSSFEGWLVPVPPSWRFFSCIPLELSRTCSLGPLGRFCFHQTFRSRINPTCGTSCSGLCFIDDLKRSSSKCWNPQSLCVVERPPEISHALCDTTAGSCLLLKPNRLFLVG